mmetsp:Transcript_30210/g.25439  ORF Transcript_30210/g.25439 Transcript_30210/m.25439 type:complete len:125 (+) Transcript_30210:398-772(+)
MRLFSANVGDSKALLIQNRKVIQLTEDHNAKSNEKEQMRVNREGGFIKNSRLNGAIALTRSLGDFKHQGKGMIAVPYITEIKVDTGDIVIACSDGVWDALQNDEILTKVNFNMDSDQISKFIIE